MPGDLILAIDQGSSSTKALLVDIAGHIVARGATDLACSYPRPGWVEQSAEEIVRSVRSAVAQCLTGIDPGRILTIGLSTQRESVLLWDAGTGRAVGPVISWQDQRTAKRCAQLMSDGHSEFIRASTGLPIDPMFSAAKAQWLLDVYDPDRTRSRQGRLRLGTIDAWLATTFGGVHQIEVGNASRTQLLNIHSRTWDADLLKLFDIPAAALPAVTASAGLDDTWSGLAPLADGTPISAVLADSHAALFAHGVRAPGEVKATYGTGSSVMSLVRDNTPIGDALCRTIAWDDGYVRYAAEGNIRSSGSTVSWLARAVGSTAGDIARLATTVEDTGGVYIVPAFNGLGAPWWDTEAIAVITGMTLGTMLAHLARAAIESIAFQVDDVLTAIADVTSVVRVLADGGASANNMLMQWQADLAGRAVERSMTSELSPLGAAHLAGRTIGLWTDDQLARVRGPVDVFTPSGAATTPYARAGWQDALRRSRLGPLNK